MRGHSTKGRAELKRSTTLRSPNRICGTIRPAMLRKTMTTLSPLGGEILKAEACSLWTLTVTARSELQTSHCVD